MICNCSMTRGALLAIYSQPLSTYQYECVFTNGPGSKWVKPTYNVKLPSRHCVQHFVCTSQGRILDWDLPESFLITLTAFKTTSGVLWVLLPKAFLYPLHGLQNPSTSSSLIHSLAIYQLYYLQWYHIKIPYFFILLLPLLSSHSDSESLKTTLCV